VHSDTYTGTLGVHQRKLFDDCFDGRLQCLVGEEMWLRVWVTKHLRTMPADNAMSLMNQQVDTEKTARTYMNKYVVSIYISNVQWWAYLTLLKKTMVLFLYPI